MRTFALALIVAGLVLAAGCGSSRRSAALTEEVGTPPTDLVQGHQVFDTYCNQCHPGGSAGLGPGINNKPLPKFLIRFQVRNGIGAMPAFSEEVISARELDELASYLIWLRHTP